MANGNRGMDGGLFGKSEEEIAVIVQEAQDAFFGVVLKHWELGTGDFPPDAQMVFNKACRDAIDVYVEDNF